MTTRLTHMSYAKNRPGHSANCLCAECAECYALALEKETAEDAPSNYLTDEAREEMGAAMDVENAAALAAYDDTVGHIHLCNNAETHGYGLRTEDDNDGVCVCRCGARKYWLANYAAWTLA